MRRPLAIALAAALGALAAALGEASLTTSPQPELANTVVSTASSQPEPSQAKARSRFGATLAHIQNLTTPGVSGVLRWWCEEQGHATEPLCVRHEISLQISLTHGTERWQLQQRRQRLLGEGAQQELANALAAYCNGSAATHFQRTSGICKRASPPEEPPVPMMEQLCAASLALADQISTHLHGGPPRCHAQGLHAHLVVPTKGAWPQPALSAARAAAAPSRGFSGGQHDLDGPSQAPARSPARACCG